MKHRFVLVAVWLAPWVTFSAGCAVGIVPGAGPPPEEPVAANEEGTVYPTSPPPDPIPEYRPPSPGWDYAWINGYWDWTGYDWSWDSGYWVPQNQASFYVGPSFVFVGGRPVYHRSYWRGDGGRRVYGYGWRGAPAPAYRARPQVPPSTWRAEHNEGWRGTPGANTWRGRPEDARRPAEVRRPEEMRRPEDPHRTEDLRRPANANRPEDMHRPVDLRRPEEHRAPERQTQDLRRPQPQGGGFHPPGGGQPARRPPTAPAPPPAHHGGGEGWKKQ